MGRRVVCSLALLGGVLLSAAAAQTIPFESNYQAGGLIPFANRWEGPVSLPLMAAEGNRSGTVWFRETDTGILIFARFSGGAPVWARSAIEMTQRDHVDIWLRTSLKVEMPEIGWGNQFGFETCDTYAGPRRIGAEDCKTWGARQQEYRKPLERLFERLWHMAPRVSGEELATTALTEALLYATNFEQEALSRLAPRAVPVLDATEGVGFSYFETVIPWDAFPPADTLSLDRIYVAIDIAHGNKLSATTAPRSAPGETPRLDALSLAKPHVSRLSGCSYPLDSDEKHGWYFPARSSTVSSSFALENQRHGYAYDPEGLSPLPVWTSYFEKPVGKTEFVCGPDSSTQPTVDCSSLTAMFMRTRSPFGLWRAAGTC